MTMIEADGAEDWQRIGRLVLAERLRRGWTQEDAAERAGVSPTSWRMLESAGQAGYRALTLARVAQVLDWPPDAFIMMLAGGEPDSTDPALASMLVDERINAMEERLDAVAAQLEEVIRRLDEPRSP